MRGKKRHRALLSIGDDGLRALLAWRLANAGYQIEVHADLQGLLERQPDADTLAVVDGARLYCRGRGCTRLRRTLGPVLLVIAAAGPHVLGQVDALLPEPERIATDGCVILLRESKVLRRGGDIVPLTALEAATLRHLYRRRGETVSRAELLEQVWQATRGLETRRVDVIISTLRAKIEPDPKRPRVIVSRRGRGYSWGAE